MRTNRLILTVFIAAFGLVTFAQKKVEFGVQGGYSYNIPKPLQLNFNSNMSGFHFGPLLKYNINEKVGIQSGMMFNYFQNSIKSTVVLNNWYNNKTIAYNIDLPIRAEYKYPLADDFYLLLFAGPNFNYAINRNVKKETVVNKKVILTTPEPNIYDSGDYSPFDAQLGFGLGLRYMGVSVRGSYDIGLLDQNKAADVKLRSNDMKLTFSYSF